MNYTYREVRKLFIDFFETHKHQILPSSSLIPPEETDLLFTNAGTNQFVKYYLGKEVPPFPNVATIQKCMRVGGKHNDINTVGQTPFHLTFFEMLGNFSFGGYFKEKAIELVWEFLTQWLSLSKENLFVSVHVSDQEAKDIWTNYISSEKVFTAESENFWTMGDKRPCGTSTEIHYKKDDGDLIEIWNIVFIDSFCDGDNIKPLDRKFIDTGAGFERLLAVRQGVFSNFHTDIFIPILEEIQKESGIAYSASTERQKEAFRIIADHARAVTFAMSDGVRIGDKGREYIVRRLIRRSVVFGKQLFGLFVPTISKIIPAVIETMKPWYPELKEEIIYEVELEEREFINRIRKFGPRVEKEFEKYGNIIPGVVAFKFYETYGIPFDVLEDLARNQNKVIDRRGWDLQFMYHRKVSKFGKGGIKRNGG